MYLLMNTEEKEEEKEEFGIVSKTGDWIRVSEDENGNLVVTGKNLKMMNKSGFFHVYPGDCFLTVESEKIPELL